jgi:outer membrane protein OmpA-like peptidoglycan-associated protein
MVSGFNQKLYSDFHAWKPDFTTEELNKSVVTLRAEGLVNLSAAFAGYNPERKFEAYAFMGPALQLAKAEIGGDEDMKALISGSLGLGAAYNINSNWALNLEVRGEVAESAFGDYSSTVASGLVGATEGATYFFGGKNFVKVTIEALLVAANCDIKKYKELLAAEQATLAATKEELAKEKAALVAANDELAKEKAKAPVEVEVAGPRAVFFTIGSAKIDAKGKVNIGLAADIMKANPDVKYIVKGYADKATGSARTNQKLSDKRAEAVYNALIKAGVSESQVEWKGLGGQDNMWENSRTLTRVVVIERAN